MIVFSTNKFNYLKELYIKKFGGTSGDLEFKIFPDGERYHRIKSEFKHQKVVLIGSIENNDDLMDIYDISCALVKLGAQSLDLLIPYFAYSTMERSVCKQEVIKAKTRSRMLSSIPKAYQGNTIRFIDLHSDNMIYYFEDSIHTVNYSSDKFLYNYYKDYQDYYFISTDEGGAKRNRNLADKLSMKQSFLTKKRINNNVESNLWDLQDFSGKAIIRDDMIRSGSTVIATIEKLIERGATDIEVICTHGVFVEDALDKITSYKQVTNILVSNSRSNVQESNKIKIFNCLDLLEEL